MKNQLLLLLFVSISTNVIAQKKQNIYYIKNGIPTTDKASADFRRIIQEPDSGSNLYNLYEFYPNDVDKTIGKVSKFEPNLVYEGMVKSFNKKGILTNTANYVQGRLVGESTSYYGNGKPKEVILYTQNPLLPPKDQFSSKLISYYDSLGNQMIKDGTGYYKEENKDGSEEGNYVNSKKDGIWKGKANNATYEELFMDGKFISGESTSKDGKIIKYKQWGDPPSYPGGINEFYQYLGREIKFPKEAIAFGIQGKLYVNFVIDKDGSLTDIKFKNTVGFGVEEEVFRVLRNSRKWNPGIQHGIPIRVAYNIPISLKQ